MTRQATNEFRRDDLPIILKILVKPGKTRERNGDKVMGRFMCSIHDIPTKTQEGVH